MGIDEQSGIRTGEHIDDESRWRKWDAVLERVRERRERMKREGSLLSAEEVDQAIDEMRGRCD